MKIIGDFWHENSIARKIRLFECFPIAVMFRKSNHGMKNYLLNGTKAKRSDLFGSLNTHLTYQRCPDFVLW